MGLVQKVNDFENKFNKEMNFQKKQKILLSFKEFSIVEQGLEEIPKKIKEEIWLNSFKNTRNFYDCFYNVGKLGRLYKEGSL